MTIKASFPVWNGMAPMEGPKALPVDFDLRVIPTMQFDLLLENTEGVIQFAQSVYVDNSSNAEALTIIFGQTMQRLVIPAAAQGVWPVIAPNQTQVTISTIPNSGARGQVIFLNVPMPTAQWGPVSISIPPIAVTSEPYPATLSDAGTDTAVAVAAQFLAANPNRRGLILSADSANFETVAIWIGANQLVNLLPGQSWQSNSFVPTDALEASAPNSADFSWHEFE